MATSVTTDFNQHGESNHPQNDNSLAKVLRDLNTDLDVVRLSQRLVSRIVETLVVDRMAVMLADVGEAIAGIDVLRHHGSVLGPAASASAGARPVP